MALSSDGRWVATGAPDGTVRLWDATTHRLNNVLHGHGERVYQAAFSPGSSLLATASAEPNGVRIWAVPSGRLLQTLPAGFTVSWHPDGETLASLSPDQTGWGVTIRDSRAGKELDRIPLGKTGSTRLAFSPDGRRVAVGLTDGNVDLWQVGDHKRVATLTRRSGTGTTAAIVAFAPDGTLAVGNSSDGRVQFWDGSTGRRLGVTTESVERTLVTALAFTPDSRSILVAGGSQSAQLWSLAEKTWVGDAFTGQTGTTNDVAVSRNGRLLAGAGTGQATMLWRRAENWLSGGETAVMLGVAFDRAGGRLATAGGSGTVRVWNLADQSVRTLGRLPSEPRTLGYAPDGTLASYSADGTVQVFDPSGRSRGVFSLPGQAAVDLAFSPDGTMLAVAASPTQARVLRAENGPNTIYLWDVRTLNVLQTLDLKFVRPSALRFTPDGRHLVLTATAPLEGSSPQISLVRLWRSQDLGEQRSAPEREFTLGPGIVTDADVDPSGRILAAAGSDRRIQLWDLTTGKKLRSLGAHPARIRAVVFSPDGGTLATATSQDTVVRLWDVASGTLLANLTGHADSVIRIAFSPDGSTMASASADGYVGVWNLRSGRAVQRICQSISGATLAADWRDLQVEPSEAPCR